MQERDGRIVLDLDNLITYGEEEKHEYQRIYVDQFSAAYNLPKQKVIAQFGEVEEEVQQNPAAHLYMRGEIPVGPATTDQMLITFSIARQILLEHRRRSFDSRPVLTLQDIRTFAELYEYTYPRTKPVFRPGAKALVLDAQKTHRLSIITGSGTINAKEKLARLVRYTSTDINDIDVRGDAKKTTVDFSHVTPSLNPWDLHDFPYRLYFNRPILSAIIASLPEHVSVAVSDQYSGDLSQYEHEGAYTVWLKTLFAAPWELPIYEDHPNGKKVHTLYEAREAIEPFL